MGILCDAQFDQYILLLQKLPALDVSNSKFTCIQSGLYASFIRTCPKLLDLEINKKNSIKDKFGIRYRPKTYALFTPTFSSF